uniref:Uncharacterized protein n=1 Tax=Ciona intestinalis TaxID=7719 RepID=H2Y129_CIOIN
MRKKVLIFRRRAVGTSLGIGTEDVNVIIQATVTDPRKGLGPNPLGQKRNTAVTNGIRDQIKQRKVTAENGRNLTENRLRATKEAHGLLTAVEKVKVQKENTIMAPV